MLYFHKQFVLQICKTAVCLANHQGGWIGQDLGSIKIAMFPNKTFLNGKKTEQFVKATCRKEEERGKLMKEHKE